MSPTMQAFPWIFSPASHHVLQHMSNALQPQYRKNKACVNSTKPIELNQVDWRSVFWVISGGGKGWGGGGKRIVGFSLVRIGLTLNKQGSNGIGRKTLHCYNPTNKMPTPSLVPV